MTDGAAVARHHTVRMLGAPARWPLWPFLPVVRRTRGALELGVVFDSRAAGLTGYSATVFRANLLALPATLEALLALPHETFDSAEELADGGWCVD